MYALVLGHKQHGKGTFTGLCMSMFGITGMSSSQFALERIIFPTLAPKYGYKTFEECYNDRDNHRVEWYTLIEAYNTPDATRLATELLDNHTIYDGMRSNMEYQANIAANTFDLIFWVDAKNRKPMESPKSMSIVYDPTCMIYVDNNGPEHIMVDWIKNSSEIQLLRSA